jgi:2-dehydropantoate 2-reductase
MYLLLGSGRLAQHIHFYFNHIGISHRTWDRRSGNPQTLQASLTESTKVIFLIKDGEIKNLREQFSSLWGNRLLVHCAGSLEIEGMESAHPLCSFTESLYEPDFYSRIPFITVKSKKTFNELFPELKNPTAAITKENKALYHALCVASGNFTQILWQESFKSFEEELGLKSEMLYPYLESIVFNLKTNSQRALTGPLARRDLQTINSNLEALKGRKLKEIYESFLKFFGIGLEP